VVVLHFSIALALQLCCLCDASDTRCLPFDIISTEQSIITGGQSVSFVLLWQPFDCVNLFVIYDIFLCYPRKINKYDDYLATANLLP